MSSAETKEPNGQLSAATTTTNSKPPSTPNARSTNNDDEEYENEINTITRSLVDEIDKEREEINAKSVELRKARDEFHKLQDDFENALKKLEKTEKSLKKSRDAHHILDRSGSGSNESLRRRKKEIEAEKKRWKELCPATGGWFVEMFLGRLNVRMGSKRERLKLKEEYELLKQKLAPIFVVLCLLCLYFNENRWLHMLLQLSLSTYYLSLALRENILRSNGSNIRNWWIFHHYLTIWQGVVLLTWPNGESYGRWRSNLHLFGLYNAILQIFQTRYQITRLYTLRSLGKAGEMDVANSDSTQIHWSESMKFLLPLIVVGQIMQAWQAGSLLMLYREYPNELQILLLGLLFCATFSGNFTTTAMVMIDKRRGIKARKSSITQREGARQSLEDKKAKTN